MRASAEDRFGNLISASTDFFISGEEDEVRLRILSSRDRLQAGKSEPVRIVSRLEPTRVLVTRIGDVSTRFMERFRPQKPKSAAVGA